MQSQTLSGECRQGAANVRQQVSRLFGDGPSWSATRWRWLVPVIALGLSASSIAGIGISPSGQASTGVPITVPPGIAGMAPQLSLSYVDGGINGPVGVGWSVQGISMITRCPASRPVDGIPRGVVFDGQDKLCLDGQRLIQTDSRGVVTAFPQSNDALGRDGDAAGSAGAVREYRTEKDTFVRVRAYGAAGGLGANGPAFFKVWTKSGQVYLYGGTESADRIGVQGPSASTAIAVWPVRRVTDSVGNYMEFRYNQANPNWGSGPSTSGSAGHEWNIAEIRYTGTAAKLPYNKVVFTYVGRPTDPAPGFDLAEAYQIGNKNVSTQRLDSITTYVNAAGDGVPPAAVPVRTYKLSYGRSENTGRSLLTAVRECAGAGAPCLPATTFGYQSAGTKINFKPNANFDASDLATLPITGAHVGVLTGDFTGTGRTDILRWTDDPSANQLWISQGDGRFLQSSTFNLTTQNLGKTDGCYTSIVMDFNGDGLSDILRIAKPSCSIGGNLIFLSKGDGTFGAVSVSADIDLTQLQAQVQLISNVPCTAIDVTHPNTAVGRPGSERKHALKSASGGDLCNALTRSTGKRFYILDLNGDGIPDIVTTQAPDYYWQTNWPPGYFPVTEDELCLGYWTRNFIGPCTRVFLGKGDGTFEEKPDTKVRDRSLYSDPPEFSRDPRPYWRLPDQADIDGDGLQDVLARYTGPWRSLGNGDFERTTIYDNSPICAVPIDFNGDGRSDCLTPTDGVSSQQLSLALGGGTTSPIAQFNLLTSTDPLYGFQYRLPDGRPGPQSIGVVVGDFDGDGRQDILRWSQTATENGIYTSRGDGSFNPLFDGGLQILARPLQSFDGKSNFQLGDFLGIGSLQILHLKDTPSRTGAAGANINQLLVNEAKSGPQDVLISVKSPTGLLSKINARVPLPNSGGRYQNDRNTGDQATGSLVDLQMPMYVVTSVTQDTGAGLLTTEYLYKGLKAERGGRGLLGFREVQQQNATPSADPRKALMTNVTQYLLRFPYDGVAAQSQTFLAPLGATSGTPLSSTVNTYCDRTSTTSPDAATSTNPCSSTAKVLRPYLRRSVETGRDLSGGGGALPAVVTVNTFNDWGDPVTVDVTTSGVVAGGTQTYAKRTSNEFCEPDSGACPNRIAGENWVLGRLTRSQVTNTVPNLLGTLTADAGSSPTARDVSGSVAAGRIEFSPSTVDFGSVTSSSGGSTKTVQLKNVGTAPYVFATGSPSVRTSSLSIVANTCPVTVAVGSTCTVDIKFTPAVGVLGAFADYVFVTRLAPAGQQRAKVTAIVVAATPPPTPSYYTFTPSSWDFGPARLGFDPAPVGETFFKALTLTNNTDVAIVITALNLALTSGDGVFALLESSSCRGAPDIGYTLYGRDSCFVALSYYPRSFGPGTATVSVDARGIYGGPSSTVATATVTGRGEGCLPGYLPPSCTRTGLPPVASSPLLRLEGAQVLPGAESITLNGRRNTSTKAPHQGVAQ